MSLDINDLPGYGPAYAKFLADKGAAEASHDQVAGLQAEVEWNRKVSAFQQEKYATVEGARKLAEARTATATKFPGVNPELYAHVQDPAEVEKFAATVQASIDQAKGGVPGSESWGQAPPPPSGQAAQVPSQTVEGRMEELRPLLDKGVKARRENAEFRRLALSGRNVPDRSGQEVFHPGILDLVIGNASEKAGVNLETGETLMGGRR
jgi:hypothetical protein